MLLTTEDLVGLAPYIGVALIAYILRLVLSRKKVRITEAILDAVAALASGAFIGATITIYPFPAWLAWPSLAWPASSAQT